MKIVLSIIIPAYNCQDVIIKCLDSLVGQTVTLDIEIIVIDDGSTDQTRDRVLRYAENHPSVKLFTTSNKGASSARNYGLNHSSGDFITFVDADDYVYEDYLESLLEKMTPEIDLVISEGIDVSEDGENVGGKITKSDFPVKLDNRYDFDAEYAHSTVWGCLYRRSLVSGLRFDNSLTVGEDAVFFHQALLCSKNAIHIAYRGYCYIRRPQSVTNSKGSQQYLDDSMAWSAIGRLFPQYQRLREQCHCLSVRHAAMGVLNSRREKSLSYLALCEIVGREGCRALVESAKLGKYRRAILIAAAGIEVLLNGIRL